MDTSHTVLLIEDNPRDARLIVELLRDVPTTGFRITWVNTLARGLAFLTEQPVEVILLDLV
ncbi:MAG TPA: guanylate cyclase, partial [Chloroflexota bacterium]|nr:guanylate cyclase [Chloroflexota bacterium]